MQLPVLPAFLENENVNRQPIGGTMRAYEVIHAIPRNPKTEDYPGYEICAVCKTIPLDDYVNELGECRKCTAKKNTAESS